MYEHIYTHIWMLVPYEERQVLAKEFDLTKSGVTEVRDTYVVTDGYTNDDLAAITADRMAAYVGSTEHFMRLWELTVAKARSIVNPPLEMQQPTVVNEPAVDEGVQFYDDKTSEATRAAILEATAGKSDLNETLYIADEPLPANDDTHAKGSKTAASKK